MPKKLHAYFELVRAVARRFDEERCMQIAGSLTFTTLLSLVPLATIALTLISAFPVFREMNEAFENYVVENLMPESAEAIAAYTDQFTANAAKLTTVGIVFLTATAVMLMLTIEHAFNQIWRVTRLRPLLQRVIINWMLLTVGPVLVGASLMLTSWLVSLSLGVVSEIPGAGIALLKTVPVILTSLAAALLYLSLPNRRVSVRDALTGGLLAGLVFEATKRGFGWYVSQFPTYKLVYGAFASVPIFLLWIYISWLIVVFGAVVVAMLPEWRARSSEGGIAPGADFLDAVRILRVLWDAHRKGEVVRLARLHKEVKAGVERIERLLDAMIDAAWVSRVAPEGWVMNHDPATITLKQVYERFVFSREALAPARRADAALDEIVRELGVRVSAHMEVSLEQLFAPGAPTGGAPPAAHVEAA